MAPPQALPLPPVRVLPFPVTPLRRLTIRAAGGVARFGRLEDGRLFPSPLGELARQYWLNLPLQYPEFGFDMFAVLPDRFEALVRVPDSPRGHDLLRGVVAHFKATVTRAGGGGDRVWAPGFDAVAVTTTAGFLAARHELVEAALLVAGRRGYCPATPGGREK